ncbi:hypothetical protein EJB05_56977, partial [Eragrostis curvula]
MSSTSANSSSSLSSSTTSGTLSLSAPAMALSPFCTVAAQAHVPIKLELLHPNYTKWSAFFLSMCGKFGLLPHIDGTAEARPTGPAWLQADSVVKSWLLTTVADDVLDLATEPNQDARALFVKIESLFNENKESRAVLLSQQFASMVQGDRTINEYCQQMKIASMFQFYTAAPASGAGRALHPRVGGGAIDHHILRRRRRAQGDLSNKAIQRSVAGDRYRDVCRRRGSATEEKPGVEQALAV